MNLLHLKYAVVIADTNSMTKAAERLYTAQPNLSRALRELEASLGVTLFTRTSNGIFPTPQGDEFLRYARSLIKQADELEAMMRGEDKRGIEFSVAGPRASYISCAFTEFVRSQSLPEGTALFYNETNPKNVISNVAEGDYRLGVLRYQAQYDASFKRLAEEKGLSTELVYEFEYVVVASLQSPIAQFENLSVCDLNDYIEIAHADPFVPSLPLSAARKNEQTCDATRHIYVFERGSQMDILSCCPNTFMWVSPIPERLLKTHGLCQRKASDGGRVYRDVLIRRKDSRLTNADKAFIDALMCEKRGLTV